MQVSDFNLIDPNTAPVVPGSDEPDPEGANEEALAVYPQRYIL